jgi:hypothetical protein
MRHVRAKTECFYVFFFNIYSIPTHTHGFTSQCARTWRICHGAEHGGGYLMGALK